MPRISFLALVLWFLASPSWVNAAWKLSKTIELPAEPTEIQFSPDGTHVAVGYKDGIVEIRDFATTKVAHRFQAHEGWMGSLYYMPSGDRLFTVGQTGKVWSTSDWTEIAEVPYVKFHGNFTLDGRSIAGLNSDRKAMIWDYESGVVVADLKMDGGVYQIGFTVDGKYLLTAFSMRSMILELATGDVIDPRTFGKGRTKIQIDSEGGSKVALSIDSFSDDDAPVHLIEPGRTRSLAALGRSWQGQQEFVDVIDLATMERLARLKPKEGVTYCSFSYDDELLAIQGSKATVWRVKNGKRIARLDGSGKVVFSTRTPDLLVAEGASLKVYSSD